MYFSVCSILCLVCIGRVVCVEVTDKKTSKARENWFPGLVVAANAQEIVKINTKEDFLVRSFKDHRYYTVPKKECKKFHRESVKIATEPALQKVDIGEGRDWDWVGVESLDYI